jgi:hypothetical protein
MRMRMRTMSVVDSNCHALSSGRTLHYLLPLDFRYAAAYGRSTPLPHLVHMTYSLPLPVPFPPI